jgi:hypothetical protein
MSAVKPDVVLTIPLSRPLYRRLILKRTCSTGPPAK